MSDIFDDLIKKTEDLAAMALTVRNQVRSAHSESASSLILLAHVRDTRASINSAVFWEVGTVTVDGTIYDSAVDACVALRLHV